MPVRHPYKRAERVSDLLRQILSEIMMVKIPHQGLDQITVTSVKMSDDLQHATVFYRVLDPIRRAEVAKNLMKLRGLIRKEASQALKMRYTPQLKFEYDESLEYGHRIDKLLASVPKSEQE